jgi:hypothetical protein
MTRSIGSLRSKLRTAIALLSTDLLYEFADGLLIPLRTADSAKLLCRQIVLKNQGAFELSSTVPGAGRNEMLVRAWETVVTADLGPNVREDFNEWLLDNFESLSSDNWAWLAYQVVLIRWYAKRRSRLVDEFHVADPEAAQALYEQHYRTPAAEIRERIAHRRQSPLSGYDQHLFDNLGMTIAAKHSEEIIDVFGPISETIERNLFRQFWSKFLPLLDDVRQQTIYASAKEFAFKECSWPEAQSLPLPTELKYPNWYKIGGTRERLE